MKGARLNNETFNVPGAVSYGGKNSVLFGTPPQRKGENYHIGFLRREIWQNISRHVINDEIFSGI